MVGDVDGRVERAGRGEEARHARPVRELDRADSERGANPGEEPAELGVAERVDLDLDRRRRGSRRGRGPGFGGTVPDSA